MSHTSRIFEQQPISVQNLNGFDLSHIFAGTSKCGQLVPVLRKLLMQASKISVGAAVNVELPPLATSFFGRIDFCIELFYVPCAILYGGWRQFISNQVATMFPSSQDSVLESGGFVLPVLDLGKRFYEDDEEARVSPAAAKIISLNSTNDGLADYLGVRFTSASFADENTRFYINILPFLAYHKIVDVFYRNCSTTKTWFAVNPNLGSEVYAGDELVASGLPRKNVSLIWHSFYTYRDLYAGDSFANEVAVSTSRVFGAGYWPADGGNIVYSLDDITFPDGVTVLETRQRTYERDYFTAGSVTPQQGSPATLNLGVEDSEVDLTVHGLRAIVALQRFEEKLNYDPSYRGIMRNLFGSSPSDALLDEPSYIGRLVLPV